MKRRHTRSNKNKRIRGGGSIADEMLRNLQTKYAAFESRIPFDSLDFPDTLVVTLKNLGDPTLQPAFLRRKYYEVRLWEDIREHIQFKIRGSPVYIAALLKLQEIIRNILDIFYELDILPELVKLYNSEIIGNALVTGLLDIENLVETYTLYKDGKLTFNTENTNDPVKKYYPTIRTCCEFIYLVSKLLTKKKLCVFPLNHRILFEYYENTFDECIRKRNNMLKLYPSKTDIPNDVERKKSGEVIKTLFETYTTCMLDNNGTFVPKISNESKTELKPCIPLIQLDEFIEPYNMYEKLLMETLYATNEYYQRREILEPTVKRNANNANFIKRRETHQLRFTSGTNILYDDKTPLNTIDLFGGGISGHTAEIGVMLRLFTNVPNESIEILQQLTAFVALIWMYDYMHHSLREILLGSTIFYNRTEAIKTYIDNNVTYLYSQIDEQTYDVIIPKVKGIINTVLNIRPADIDGIPVEPLKPMIKFLLSSPSSTEPVDPYILQKLKSCKNAVDTFKTDIQRNHPHIYERISWPTDEMCNTNKHVIQSRKDYNTIIALQEPTATATGGMRHRKRHITRRIRRSKTPS